MQESKRIHCFDKEITEKLVDIYNYMAKKQSTKLEIRFDSGIKFRCEIELNSEAEK